MVGLRCLDAKVRRLQGILNIDDDIEEEFEIDINEAEPAFLKGQSSRSGVEVCCSCFLRTAVLEIQISDFANAIAATSAESLNCSSATCRCLPSRS